MTGLEYGGGVRVKRVTFPNAARQKEPEPDAMCR
jgi:hypothetical protein